ncbi:MAG TPA: hypothetical protein VHK46_02015 [Gaiellaceae bacterium]|jgi:hypothetical protein|nr:hypothetical protein [Gaiellaceae bacterium]
MARKTLITAVATLAMSLALTAPAAADKPIIAPSPFGEFTGEFCDEFPVRIRETTNRGKAIIFSSGATVVTGTLKVEVTNLETGKTVSLNISGPAMFSSDGTTLFGPGPWLLFGEPGFFGPGSPAILETNHGRLVIDLVSGEIVHRVGRRVDLCPLLAG